MKLELNKSEISQIKELIFDYIDRIGGFDQLSDEMKDILSKMSKIPMK